MELQIIVKPVVVFRFSFVLITIPELEGLTVCHNVVIFSFFQVQIQNFVLVWNKCLFLRGYFSLYNMYSCQILFRSKIDCKLPEAISFHCPQHKISHTFSA